jgi:DNA-binding NarL/FixJ family response regulator
MLSAEMRRANMARIEEIESELAHLGTADSALAIYVHVNRAMRAGWEGRFEEAYRSLFACLERVHFDLDRIFLGAHCSLYLALLGRREESGPIVRDVLREADSLEQRGSYRIRIVAVARMLCAIAEGVAGRATQAEKIVRSMTRRADPVATCCGEAAEAFISARRRHVTAGASELSIAAARLSTVGYGEMTRLLDATAAFLKDQPAEAPVDDLTPAECAVLRRLAEGSTPKEIAATDGRSVYTIQAHVANAIAKLGCHGRNEAIAAARRRGLLG